MSSGEKELEDEGLSRLRESSGTGKAGDISAMATLLGVPVRGQGIEDIDRWMSLP